MTPAPPRPGSQVHIPHSWYLDENGEKDEFVGGMCTVERVFHEGDVVWVAIQERPGHAYSWKKLYPLQTHANLHSDSRSANDFCTCERSLGTFKRRHLT